MIFRKALLATTMLMFPLAVEAQTASEPVTGPYIGAAGGFNIKVNPNINNVTSSIPGAGGIPTPNASLSTGIGAAAAGTLGYGLGNGMRIELSGDWMNNSFSRTNGNNRFGLNASTGAGGHETVWGPMVNLDYDFYDLVPLVVPYVGLGLGYQWAALNDFTTSGTTPAGTAATISSGDKRGAFAAQGIVGAAYEIPSVPGLALTAEYRIMALTGTRTYNAGLTVATAGGGSATRFGSFELGHELNNTFVFGIRYAFGAPPPPPPPAPVAMPAPAPARSYLVFFDWD
jgi:OmpA-OmpF porin, OOP family